MKKINKIIGTVALLGIISLPLNASALTKSETIYASLNNEGESYKQIINNHLYNNVSGEVEDITT